MPGYVIVIPARYASERLPGKMLLDLCGKPLLQHTWERAIGSAAAEVVIATDDERIEAAARGFGARVVMTSGDHRSGSDRIAECARLMSWSEDRVVVNLQGDEPLMPASCLDQVAEVLGSDPEAQVSTLYREIQDPADVRNPNVVKVVAGVGGEALLFSRSAIPHARDFESMDAAAATGIRWLHHLGLYA
ncbi:MAG: 3-deoxy-manno-octulosonate cytidylyltransferase, partial [Thiohalobacterales bacterium]|nr:3-deoxy-manno-octulosonate cytidylyltransferase [Thiohalobacterales bacterium]